MFSRVYEPENVKGTGKRERSLRGWFYSCSVDRYKVVKVGGAFIPLVPLVLTGIDSPN